jgi:hypothetical protein
MFTVKAHNRHSPVAHKVKSHTRDGNRVHSYIRGHGIPPKKEPFKPTGKPRQIIDEKYVFPKPTAWTVNFRYGKKAGDGESVVVLGESYHSVLAEAYDDRYYKHRVPIAVEIIDPDLNTALSFLSGAGAKLKQAGSLGAEFAVKAGGAVKSGAEKVGGSTAFQTVNSAMLKGAGENLQKRGGFFSTLAGKHLAGKSENIAFKLQSKKAREYLAKAWSSDNVERATARAGLKKFYPEIWEATDFSTERNVQRVEITHKNEGSQLSDEDKLSLKEAKEKRDFMKKSVDAITTPNSRNIIDLTTQKKQLPSLGPEHDKARAEKAKMIADRDTPEGRAKHAKYVADVAGQAKKILEDKKEEKRSRADKRDENR